MSFELSMRRLSKLKIAVIGSRTGFCYEDIAKVLTKEFTNINNSLITGGAGGVDEFAIKFAILDCVGFEIIRPIDKKSKIHYLFRNIEIITKADRIIAFWNGESKGTKFVIDYALARDKDLIIIKK